MPTTFISTGQSKPGPFSKGTVADNATDVSISTALSWTASENADSYEYRIGTVTGGGSWTPATSPIYPTLVYGDEYFWQVKAINENGETEANDGAEWSFTVEDEPIKDPGMFYKSAPSNTASGIAVNTTLTWGTSQYASYYQYRISTTSGGGTWTTANSGISMSLSNNTTYYWQVRAVGVEGSTPSYANNNTEWSFTTIVAAPAAFNKTAPTNGATNVSKTTTLKWGASSGATSYEYRYSTTSGGGTYRTAASGVAPSLNYSTKYYWQVRAINAGGTTYANASTEWYFTTEAAPPVNILIPANGIIFSESSTAPSGFTSTHITAGKFIVPSTNNTTSGGSNTHTHSITSPVIGSSGAHTHSVSLTTGGAISTGAQCIYNQGGTSNSVSGGHTHTLSAKSSSSGGHTHTLSSLTTGSADNNPPWKSLYAYKAISETSIPAGAIIMWYGSTYTFPAGFSLYTSTNGRYIKAGGNTTGGASTHLHTTPSSADNTVKHSHTFSGTSSTSSQGTGIASSSAKSAGCTTHSHAIADTLPSTLGAHSHAANDLGSSSSLVTSTEVFFIKNNSSATVPKGAMILLGTTTVPSGWTILSSTYQGGLLKGYDLTSVSKSSPTKTTVVAHTHSKPTELNSKAFTHSHSYVGNEDAVDHDGSNACYGGTTCGYASSNHWHSTISKTISYTTAHTHTLTFTLGTATMTPAYQTAVMIVRTT